MLLGTATRATFTWEPRLDTVIAEVHSEPNPVLLLGSTAGLLVTAGEEQHWP